ncbi:MAG: hypothetical protein ACK5LC_18435 [Coprobacillaceae bacterium]
MKKVISLFFVAFLLIGCSSGSSKEEKKETKKEEEKIESLDPKSEQEVKDLVKFKFTEMTLSSTIEPPNASGYYWYYEAKKEGCQLLAIKAEVTNESKKAFDISDVFSGKFEIEGNAYTLGFLTEEDGGSSVSAYASIDPKVTATVYMYAEVPSEDLSNDVNLLLKVNKKSFNYELERDKLEPVKEYKQYGEAISSENNGTLTTHETLITKKLEPSNATGYYTYYEVSDTNANSYIVLKTTLKNEAASTIEIKDIMGGVLIVDGKYEYRAAIFGEESGGTRISNYASLDPLAETTVYIAFEVPDTVLESTAEYKINVFGSTYYINK